MAGVQAGSQGNEQAEEGSVQQTGKDRHGDQCEVAVNFRLFEKKSHELLEIFAASFNVGIIIEKRCMLFFPLHSFVWWFDKIGSAG